MQIFPFHLTQVFTNEKVKNQKKATLTPSSGPQRNLKQLCAAEAIFCCPTENSRHLEA
jgi:hypothetical protein